MPHKNTLRKKVVFILPVFCMGGAERALITLMNNLDTDRFEPSMVVLNDSGPLKDWVQKHITVHSLGNVRVSRAFFKLKAKLTALQPDIVITTLTHSNFLLLSMKRFFPKTKFIVRETSVPSSLLRFYGNKALLIKFLYKRLYKRADIVLSPSQEIIDEFKDLIKINIHNHRVLFNQVDLQALRSAINSDIHFPAAKPSALRLVCAGRLHRQKGYDRLIETLVKLPPQQDWELIILGDGEEKNALQALINKNGLKRNIRLYGNTKEPWPIIAAADCFLLPSRWEGMPNVVLESLACGTRVIASSDANGVREIQEYCKNDELLIASNMTEMGALIQGLQPLEKQTAQTSILPEEFSTESVMKKFEAYLD